MGDDTEGYSLDTVVTDNIITAKRWVQHLVKLMTHASASWVALGVVGNDRPHLAAVLGCPVLFVCIKTVQSLYPTPGFALTKSHFGDLLTDGSLAMLPMAAGYLSTRDFLAVAALVVGCPIVWGAFHKEARP